MPKHVTQDELAEVCALRASGKILEARVADLKMRLHEGAAVERGDLWPEIRSSFQTDFCTRALRDTLGDRAFEALKARLPMKELRSLWVLSSDY